MIELLYSLTELSNAVTILVALSTFATVLTVAAPLLQGDRMRSRMKGVISHRERLRAQHRVALGAKPDLRLREKPKGTLAQLVQALNLRQLFEADASRQLLRQAGLRSEKHLVSYLASRLLTPIILGIVVFVYSSTVFADRIPAPGRLAITFMSVVLGYYLPAVFLKNMMHRRQESIRRAWSDALDLLLICVESGMSIEPAMQRVAREIGSQSVPLAEELVLTNAELSYIGDRRKAFENLASRTGLPTVKSVMTSLIQSERYGTPLGQALRVLAQENRDHRMQEAEKKAAALPPKLTVPMILFFMPVIFIVILGPAFIQLFATI
jgi:tight adherence protein C